MKILKDMDYDDVGFEIHSSRQFVTVVFHCSEDGEQTLINAIHNGRVNQFIGGHKHNPSAQGIATCVYVKEEGPGEKFIRICTFQHKGTTRVEVHSVESADIDDLFANL